MKAQKKIGWQKYEDYIEQQINSPILNNIIKNIASITSEEYEEIEDGESDLKEEEEYEEGSASYFPMPPQLLPITTQLIEDVSMLSSFDCWIGHTNFDITYDIKDILNEAPGVEIMKICSRYRFFIGIGKMFDFKDVRTNIEELLINGEDFYGSE